MGTIQTHPYFLEPMERAEAFTLSKRNLSRKDSKKLILAIVIVLLLAISPLLLAALFLPHERQATFKNLSILFLCVVFPVLFVLASYPFAARFGLWVQRVLKLKSSQDTVVVIFSGQGVDFTTSSLSVHADWSHYQTVKENRELFLLMKNKDDYQIIPKRVLEQTQIDELRDLLKQHIKNFMFIS